MSNILFKDENSKGVRISQEEVAEIRNALTIILGYAQLLEKEPEITQEQKRRLEAIAKQTHRIASILEEGNSQDCNSQDCDKKFSGGILRGLKEIKEILLEK